MVLGMKAKARKGPTEKLNYLVHIEEIKPWPPSHSLRSLRSVQIQWENGERSSRSTSSVVPSLGSGVNDGKIEFNESFRLPVTLLRNMSVKAGDADTFQKNCLEFSLYEPRRDKTLKGQLLGTAVIDLADYGIIKGSLSINVPVNCQRNYKNTAQPLLYVRIQPVDKGRTNISSKDGFSNQASVEKNGAESVSDLMKEEYAEEAEINNFSDDDVSSHSSAAVSSAESNGSLPPTSEQNNGGGGEEKQILTSDKGHMTSNALSSTPRENTAVVQSAHSSSSSSADDQIEEESNNERMVQAHEGVANGKMEVENGAARNVNDSSISSSAPVDSYYQNQIKANGYNALHNEEKDARASVIEETYPNQNEDRVSVDTGEELDSPAIGVSSFSRANHGSRGVTPSSDRVKHVMSVRSTSDSVRSSGMNRSVEEVKEVAITRDVQNGTRSFRTNERKDVKFCAKDTRSTLLEAKVQRLEHRIQILESELREVAAIEVSLYSVVAEHGSSMAKVHAPARRLSRMYLHACEDRSLTRSASAARSVISGLVLISKACGNDVPRLTYWLSNSVVLRGVISQAVANRELPISPAARIERVNTVKGPSPLKWESSPGKKGSECMRSLDWEDPQTFIYALEKVEAWIFSRTIESIWWQTLTPHMQSAGGKAIRKATDTDDQNRGNISVDLWKKAFKDAFERLCPVRAAGHECGCLPMLPRLIMEQCVARLDVAMFNALLRESADEIPTDPVSDPIGDSEVLPIPAGRSSFGAGALLKNAIGNWSRWLTDLFGMDDDLTEDEEPADEDDDDDDDDDDERQDSSFKSFYLLNALSDLMMLPKDMLLSKSIRKEVCPTFGASLIKRVLSNFVPDEFCPDPIPKVVFEALDYEDPIEAETGSVTTYPYIAAPPLYVPPSPASVVGIIGENNGPAPFRRSGSAVLRKSYTSDDELDELNSPMASLLLDGTQSSPVARRDHQNALRYELLRDVWLNSE
ncbi:uncharacterized protein LOC116195897 isoform X2 [Punica granatum]|uniref:Uncharacterized protein LOC116195897 isoform X2 n=1 Tax=Punica granatum TaxID=22663 RepID=A0A6P8CFE2_PUNGR|nr:uncharacterized protein LOC116195897 isoform X2 [Punica granatum]